MVQPGTIGEMSVFRQKLGLLLRSCVICENDEHGARSAASEQTKVQEREN